MDPRIKKLAAILVNHSTKIKKGDVIEIASGNEAKELVNEVAKLILLKGAFPRISASIEGFGYTYFKYANNQQLTTVPKIRLYEARNTNGIISVGTEYNTKELSSIDPKKIALRRKTLKPISDIMIHRDNWVVCEFPTHALAQDAEMSLEEFQDFLFSACLKDWKKEERKQEKIKKVLDKGKQVHVVGKDTNIRFSIKGRTSIKCYGTRNLPDGEVYIAPVEDSTEGHIKYDYPIIYAGKEIENIYLEFKKGRVIKATASKNQDLLKKMIRVDPGACKLGEFGIGTNYGIKKFIKQILFDEKIGGTIHLALGMAYKKGGGRNDSAIHWDMIKDLRKGGEVYIDGKLLQKNGKFAFKF